MAAQSAQRAIRAKVAALLLARPAVASGNVHENRDYALPVGVFQQVHVNYRDSQPEPVAILGAPIDWTTGFEIVVKTRRNGSASAEDAADALWVEIYHRVMADKTLGGLVGALDAQDATVEDDQADTDTCRLIWRFSVQHRTANNTLTTP